MVKLTTKSMYNKKKFLDLFPTASLLHLHKRPRTMSLCPVLVRIIQLTALCTIIIHPFNPDGERYAKRNRYT